MAATPSDDNRVSLATCVGLFVALVVPFLSYAVGRLIFGVAQSGPYRVGPGHTLAGLVAHATIDGIGLLIVPIVGHGSR